MHTGAMPLADSLIDMRFGVDGHPSPRLRSSAFCRLASPPRRSERWMIRELRISDRWSRSCSESQSMELVYGMQRLVRVFLFDVFTGDCNRTEECPLVGEDSDVFELPKWRWYARCGFGTRPAPGSHRRKKRQPTIAMSAYPSRYSGP